jgi:plasmid replication initiation protein
MAGTVIKTTVDTGDEATVEGFALISSYKYNSKGSMHADRLRYLEVTLCEWLYRAIEAAEVLPISRDYFRLRRPLDRRLYDLARKHCGAKERWRISIDKRQKKSGSKQERKSFVRHLRETIEADHLPDYGWRKIRRFAARKGIAILSRRGSWRVWLKSKWDLACATRL